MDIQESLQSTIYSLTTPAYVDNDESTEESSDDKPHYFLEEIYHSHSRETDYWLGTYGSDQRIWLGDHMTLEQALAEAEKMTGTRPCEKHGEAGKHSMLNCRVK